MALRDRLSGLSRFFKVAGMISGKSLIGPGPRESIIINHRCARAAQQKTSKLNQHHQHGGVPENRKCNRAPRHVPFHPAIAEKSSAAKFFWRPRTGKQCAQTFTDAAAARLPRNAQAWLGGSDNTRLSRIRQNRNEAYGHLRRLYLSETIAHGGCKNSPSARAGLF